MRLVIDVQTAQTWRDSDVGPFRTPEEQLARERDQMVASRMQVFSVLRGASLLVAVEAQIALADADTQNYWNDFSVLNRISPTLADIQTALGWSDTQVDDLFRTAMAITV